MSKRPRDPYKTDFSRDPLIVETIMWAIRKIGLDPAGLLAWDPGAGLGHLLRLRAHGLTMIGTDITAWEGADPSVLVGPQYDVFGMAGQLDAAIKLVPLNPPYAEALCARMILKLLDLAPSQWILAILPANWINAKGRVTKENDSPRRGVLSSPRFHAWAPFGDRLFWSEPGPDGMQDNDPMICHSLMVFRPASHPLTFVSASAMLWPDSPKRTVSEREPWMKVRPKPKEEATPTPELRLLKGGKL